MITVQRTFKFRLYPTKGQEQTFLRQLGCCRVVWNHFLERNKQEYEDSKKFIFYYDMASELREYKKDSEHLWLSEVNSQSLQQGLKKLESSIKRTFKPNKHQGGFPKFKSRRQSRESFVVPQHFEIRENSIRLPKVRGLIKVRKHRELVGKPKSLVILRDIDQWYVCISCEFPDVPSKPIQTSVGVDLGLKTFVQLSNGSSIKNTIPDFSKKLEHQQRNLARCQKGSNHRKAVKTRLQKTFRKQRFSRLDFLHKVTTVIAKQYDLVGVENLNINGMVKNHHIAKAVNTQCWGKFVELLKYKLEDRGGQLVKVDRFYPSTKTCSNCGFVQDMPLDKRTYQCQACGFECDRDLNASINIQNEGLRIVGSTVGTTGIQAGGESVSPEHALGTLAVSVKPEAPTALAVE